MSCPKLKFFFGERNIHVLLNVFGKLSVDDMYGRRFMHLKPRPGPYPGRYVKWRKMENRLFPQRAETHEKWKTRRTM